MLAVLDLAQLHLRAPVEEQQAVAGAMASPRLVAAPRVHLPTSTQRTNQASPLWTARLQLCAVVGLLQEVEALLVVPPALGEEELNEADAVDSLPAEAVVDNEVPGEVGGTGRRYIS